MSAVEEIQTLKGRLAEVQQENARLQELVRDVGGRTTEYAVVKQLEGLKRSMREGNAPEALQNLISACATLAAYSIANGRWAVLEGENVNSVTAENERLRKIEVAAKELCQRIYRVRGTGEWGWDLRLPHEGERGGVKAVNEFIRAVVGD